MGMLAVALNSDNRASAFAVGGSAINIDIFVDVVYGRCFEC